MSSAEYRVMAYVASEVVWLRALLGNLDLQVLKPTKLYCNNHMALYIPENLIFHECTKYIELDCHFIRGKIQLGIIQP